MNPTEPVNLPCRECRRNGYQPFRHFCLKMLIAYPTTRIVLLPALHRHIRPAAITLFVQCFALAPGRVATHFAPPKTVGRHCVKTAIFLFRTDAAAARFASTQQTEGGAGVQSPAIGVLSLFRFLAAAARCSLHPRYINSQSTTCALSAI